MSKYIVLESQTNSDQDLPPYAQFDKDELDALIARFSTSAIWSDKSVKTISVDSYPYTFFCEDAAGEEDYEDDHAASQWEYTLCDVSPNSIMIKFSHDQDGTEMFFTYQQE